MRNASSSAVIISDCIQCYLEHWLNNDSLGGTWKEAISFLAEEETYIISEASEQIVVPFPATKGVDRSYYHSF